MPEILFEDEYIIAVNKPAGILAQADNTGRPSLHGILTDYLNKQGSDKSDVYCAALHRLDRPVSGVMLFAKTPVAAGRLSDDIKHKKVRKFYCAIASPWQASVPGDSWIELNQQMVRRRDRGYIADVNDPGSHHVSLLYKVFAGAEESALIQVELITGKRHQIRVQLSSLGSPILGDRFYGSKIILDDGIIALHAHYLCFTHPMTKEPLTVSAPLPQHMAGIVSNIPLFTDYIKD